MGTITLAVWAEERVGMRGLAGVDDVWRPYWHRHEQGGRCARRQVLNEDCGTAAPKAREGA